MINLGFFLRFFFANRAPESQLSDQSSDDSFLFQRISFLIQRFNAVLLHDSFMEEVE